MLHLSFPELLSVFFFLGFLNGFSFHCDSLLFSLSDLGLFVFNGSLVFFDDLFIFDFGVGVEFSGIFDQCLGLLDQDSLSSNVGRRFSLDSKSLRLRFLRRGLALFLNHFLVFTNRLLFSLNLILLNLLFLLLGLYLNLLDSALRAGSLVLGVVVVLLGSLLGGG